jgi:hypothetical protein
MSKDEPTIEELALFGWAPGNYMFTCRDCPEKVPGPEANNAMATGAKRSYRCREHATAQWQRIQNKDDLIIQLESWPPIPSSPIETSQLMHEAASEIRMLRAAVYFIGNERISSLIRYNSEQVVKRRVLMAKVKLLTKALTGAARQFRYYATEHRKKAEAATDSTIQLAAFNKAHTNDTWADMMEVAANFELDPSEMGKP